MTSRIVQEVLDIVSDVVVDKHSVASFGKGIVPERLSIMSFIQ